MTFKFGYIPSGHDEIDALVLSAFAKNGGIRTIAADWDILWYSMRPPPRELYQNVTPTQRINHIPGADILTNKAKLADLLTRWKETKFSDEDEREKFSIHPATYPLATRREEIKQILAMESPPRWLLKPVSGTGGRSIIPIDSADALPVDDNWIVQQRIDSPMLADGFNFSIRRFLLVVNCDPLVAYLFHDGIIDLAVELFEENNEKVFRPYMHIVNRGVLLKHPDYQPEVHRQALLDWLESLSDQQAANIERQTRCILSGMIDAARQAFADSANKFLADGATCFELIGVDIMFDQQGKGWLLECNRTPSLKPGGSGTVKNRLVEDLVALIDLTRKVAPQFDPDYPEEFRGFSKIKI